MIMNTKKLLFILTFILAGFFFSSCSDSNNSAPSDIGDVSTDPNDPDYVVPSSVDFFDIIGMVEGEESTPQVFSRVTYKFSYKEYPNQNKFQTASAYSKVEYKMIPDEAYTVGEKVDTEPGFEKIIAGDVYWDEKQDFVVKSYYNGDGLGKEEITFRRYFRDLLIQTDMLDANYTFRVELQLPVQVKTEQGMIVKLPERTKEDIAEILYPRDYLGANDWVLNVYLDNPEMPWSTLELSLDVFYFNRWCKFKGPKKTFIYDPNKYE